MRGNRKRERTENGEEGKREERKLKNMLGWFCCEERKGIRRGCEGMEGDEVRGQKVRGTIEGTQWRKS